MRYEEIFRGEEVMRRLDWISRHTVRTQRNIYLYFASFAA